MSTSSSSLVEQREASTSNFSTDDLEAVLGGVGLSILTAFHSSVGSGDIKAVEVLVKNFKSSLNVEDLFTTINLTRFSAEMFGMLRRYIPDISTFTAPSGYGILDSFCLIQESDNSVKILEMIIEDLARIQPGNINKNPTRFSTPLSQACSANNTRIIDLLLINGADPHLQYYNGYTAIDEERIKVSTIIHLIRRAPELVSRDREGASLGFPINAIEALVKWHPFAVEKPEKVAFYSALGLSPTNVDYVDLTSSSEEQEEKNYDVRYGVYFAESLVSRLLFVHDCIVNHSFRTKQLSHRLHK